MTRTADESRPRQDLGGAATYPMVSLTLLYAVVPCGLKVLAMILVWRLPREGGGPGPESGPPPHRAQFIVARCGDLG